MTEPTRAPADERLTDAERIMLAHLVGHEAGLTDQDPGQGLMIPQLRYALPHRMRYTYKVIGLQLVALVDRGLLRQYRVRNSVSRKHGPRRYTLTDYGRAVIALHQGVGDE